MLPYALFMFRVSHLSNRDTLNDSESDDSSYTDIVIDLAIPNFQERDY